MTRKVMVVFGCLAWLLAFSSARAQAPSGAIFTTVEDGTEVNLNQYANKEDVYLDGGPGPGAPQDAAGLDDGVYVFQVTDPSGKVLLSTDIAACRRFTVSGGIITGVVPAGGCEHHTGVDVDHGAATVQLMPYDDTPNRGGVYKVWATLEVDYLAGCVIQGVQNGLDVVDCGPLRRAGGIAHGFIPSESKTDNFKVKFGEPREIDLRFVDQATGGYIDGLATTWIDTVGGSNRKWSVWNPSLLAFHEAHVENVETGPHQFDVFDQPGCKVGQIKVDGELLPTLGPQTVTVNAKASFKSGTIWVDVTCKK